MPLFLAGQSFTTANRRRAVVPAAVAGGPVTITESFNKADGDTLGPDLTWTETSGDLDIVSNQAKSAAGLAEARAESALSTTNHYAQAACYKNGVSSVNDNARVLARFDASARTHYGIAVRADDTYDLFRRVTGTFTSIASASLAWADGDVIRIEVNGTSISAKKNGAAAFVSNTDSNITTGVRGGIAINQTSCSIDLFEAGDL